MVQSTWNSTWHDDFDRVLYSMTKRERNGLQRWGLLSVQGRRVFVAASGRLSLDVAYSAYVLEQAVLALNPTPVAMCLTCGVAVGSDHGLHLTFWAPGRFDEIGFTDMHFCSSLCLRASAQEFADSGSWGDMPSHSALPAALAS